MTIVRFRGRAGGVTEINAAPGTPLLPLAQGAGQPLEGTCGGQMACGTCHVIVDPASWAALPRASDDELDMLDLVRGAVRTSRLACQVSVPDLPIFEVTAIG